ncbi:MAG: hypothetical protein ACSLEW_08895 [Nocardioides sp.]
MKTSTGRYEPTDADVVDAIALMLGTTREWDSSMLEQVAETVGRVRPSAPLSDAEDDVFEQFVDGILDRVAYSPTRLAWLTGPWPTTPATTPRSEARDERGDRPQ